MQTMDCQGALKQYFGYTAFREGQREVIDALLSGLDALCVMPTGAGKSVCYQIPSLILPGVSLVVSPLISLMQDQVAALTQAGVSAAYLNSSLTPAQYAAALSRAARGQYKIIYVAPERLMTDSFLELAGQLSISMLTVDEAHCISQWGQDFRPSYTQIADFIAALPTRPVVGAFTATATHKVRADIEDKLRLREPFKLTTGFNRQNLYYDVQKPAGKLPALLRLLADRREQSGIVYCATRKNAESVSDALRGAGYAAAPYHAGLPDGVRTKNQEDFQYDRIRIIVATNAFGMGIDKANVSFVIHYNMPKNIESYYQEAGRAGRDGSPAHCILLYSPQDVRTNLFLIERGSARSDIPPEAAAAQKELDRELLKYMTWYATTSDCYRGYILRYFGERAPVYCGSCGNCNREFETVDITVPAQKILSCIVRLKRRGRQLGKYTVADILHGSKNERILRMGFSDLPTYGIMPDTPVRTICDIIDHLVELGHLAVKDSQFPVLLCAPSAKDILDGSIQLEMKLPKRVHEKKRLESQVEEDPLFLRLKQLRAKLADAASVPAYIVFSDATLRQMCVERPTTAGQLLDISGVGSKKAERYGEQFLGAIRDHLEGDGAGENGQ